MIKVTASGFELSDINITGLPTGRRVIISNGYVVVDHVYYTITWKNADGTTLETDTGVSYGTTPTYNGSTPTKTADATYHYTFKSWSPAVAAITGATTYTAQFNTVSHTWTTIERYTGDTCQEDGGCKQKCSVCSKTQTLKYRWLLLFL